MLQRVDTKPMTVPADIDTAVTRPDWRDSVSWPVGLAETNTICALQVRDALTFARGLDNELLRDATLLALPVVLAYGRAIVLAALAIQRAQQRGDAIEGQAAELDYLKTGKGIVPVRSDPVLPAARFNLGYARRVARMRSWTPLLQMPRTLLRPDAIAISHNALLCAMARDEPRAIGFRHAETILDAARRNAGSGSDVRELSGQLAEAVSGGSLIGEPYRRRALTLIEAVAQSHLGKAARDLTALRGASLPVEIWTGSGGLYAPRAIGIEILRRGGHVRRFDHGTPRGFVEAAEITSLLETSVSSEFVLTTQGAADICRNEMKRAPFSPFRPVTISGGHGDPMFRRVPRQRARGAGRLRVVYAPTQLLGFRQLVPALPPDPVHLDWQMRVAEFLNALPVDFICQAHPEGLFGGKPHPLEAVVPTRRGNFHEQIEQADIFVFDYPSTTALWEAACTDARIVFLDMGAGHMTPDVARLFAQRVTVLPVAHDEDHRMTFDQARLRDAVLGEIGPVDPSAFRVLLAGAA